MLEAADARLEALLGQPRGPRRSASVPTYQHLLPRCNSVIGNVDMLVLFLPPHGTRDRVFEVVTLDVLASFSLSANMTLT